MRSLLFTISVLLLVTSCSLQKRKYLPGWYHDRAQLNSAAPENAARAFRPEQQPFQSPLLQSENEKKPSGSNVIDGKTRKEKKKSARLAKGDPPPGGMSTHAAKKSLESKGLKMAPAAKGLRTTAIVSLLSIVVFGLGILILPQSVILVGLALVSLIIVLFLTSRARKKVLAAGGNGVDENVAIINNTRRLVQLVLKTIVLMFLGALIIVGIYMLLFGKG